VSRANHAPANTPHQLWLSPPELKTEEFLPGKPRWQKRFRVFAPVSAVQQRVSGST
jgi:hypothetical protein